MGLFLENPLLVFCFCGLQLSSPGMGAPNVTVIKDMLMSHFSQPRHHVSNPEYKMAARQFIQNQFEEMGMILVNHNFSTILKDVEGVNVIGVLRGADFNTENDSILAVSAHYDTMRNTPGVNDNGAAVAVMLEAARELSISTPRVSTVLFIAFDFEEGERENDSACNKTKCGSRKLLDDWLPSYFSHWPDLPWLGLLNMDIILNFDDKKNAQQIPTGFNFIFPEEISRVHADQREGDFLFVAGRTPEDKDLLNTFSRSWILQGNLDFEIEVIPLSKSVRGYAVDLKRSDHDEFWNRNLSAIFLTDTGEYRGYMKKCYHQACDNITFATDSRLLFAEKVARSIVTWVNFRAPPVNTAASLSAAGLSVLLAAFFVIDTSQGLLRQRFD